MADHWRCFHCDEVFTDPESAADHFGLNATAPTACVMDKLVQVAFDVLHHDRSEGSSVDVYEQAQLRKKFAEVFDS
jgi:hypothetical protein